MINNTSRRQLLKSAGAAALSAPFIHGASKSGAQKLILGEGAYKFEATHDWGELPASIKYGNTHGVVEDSHGRIYVFHTVHKTSVKTDAMVVFDAKGKFVTSWGSEYAGGAHGLHIQKEGNAEYLYLCDTKRSTVTKTTLDGKVLLTLGYPKESDKYRMDKDSKPLVKYIPTNLAVAANGDIFVGDGYGSSFINKYSKDGVFLKTFGGGKTKEKGSTNSPHGIFIDARSGKEELVVADRSNNRLQYFSLDGEHLRFVTQDMASPCHFSFRKDLMLIPDLAARVQILDKNNKMVANLGDDSKSEWRKTRVMERDQFKAGKFVAPHGACFDHKGNIFVSEWVEVGRITKLRKV